MAIVDVYDVLVNKRVYKKAIPVKEAINILIDGSGKQFDEELLNLFLVNIGKITES